MLDRCVRVLVVSTLVVGCASPSIEPRADAAVDPGVDAAFDAPVRNPRPASVVVWPYDLDTNTTADEASSELVGAAGVRVFPSLILPVFEANDLPMFERAVSLVTWPERTPVPGHMQVTPNGSVVDVSFVPDALDGRWYALVFDVRETSASYSTQAPTLEPVHPDDEIVRRFFPESLPIVIASVGGGTPSATELRFGATEPVFLPAGASVASLVSLEVGGRTLTCTASTSAAAELASAGQTDLVCDPADLSQQVVLHVATGIVSRTGVPLRDQNAATDGLTLSWVPARDGLWAPAVGSDALFALTSATAHAP